MDWQILNSLEAVRLRMTHCLNLLYVLWFAFDSLNSDEMIENDRIASAIYIVSEQFDNAADEIKNCIDMLQAKQKQIHGS